MANRPIFLPNGSSKTLTREVGIEFQWFPGMSASQKRKSIGSLHKAAKDRLKISNILEISSKSENPLGVQLSAFNLLLSLNQAKVSVEVAFQSGKRFIGGGPYEDLLSKSSREAKRDPRLKNSGQLIDFRLEGKTWGLEPKTAFYDWLYLSALSEHESLAIQLCDFDGFTDIEFNPKKSINCQARSAALYVSLKREKMLESALSSKEAFLKIIGHKDSATSQQVLF